MRRCSTITTHPLAAAAQYRPALSTSCKSARRHSLGDARYTAATMPTKTAHQKNRQLTKPTTKTQFVDCRNNLGPPRLKIARLLPLEDSSKS